MPEKQFQIRPNDLPRQPEKVYLIVDVRSSEEYKCNRIRGAINLPFSNNHSNNQEKLEASLPIDKQTDILLYSQDASRSIYALIFYYLSGYENVRYIDGGLNSCKAANRKISTLHHSAKIDTSNAMDITDVITDVTKSPSKPGTPVIHIIRN